MAKKARKPYTNPDVDSSTLSLEGALGDAYAGLLRYVKDELASLKRDGDIIARDRENLSRISRMVNQLQARARELGFGDVLDEQTYQMRELLDAIQKEGVKLKVDGQIDDVLVDQLLLGGTRAIVREELAAAGTIEQILIHDALGVPWDKLVGSLELELGIRESQAITKATSAISNFHTQMRTDYFTEGGVEWFLYNGPDYDRTREFCSHFVGKRVTLDTLDSHSTDYGRKYPLSASVGLGGYNCRHELVPILPENVDDYPEAK